MHLHKLGIRGGGAPLEVRGWAPWHEDPSLAGPLDKEVMCCPHQFIIFLFFIFNFSSFQSLSVSVYFFIVRH